MCCPKLTVRRVTVVLQGQICRTVLPYRRWIGDRPVTFGYLRWAIKILPALDLFRQKTRRNRRSEPDDLAFPDDLGVPGVLFSLPSRSNYIQKSDSRGLADQISIAR
jgi:hypothetical protein